MIEKQRRFRKSKWLAALEMPLILLIIWRFSRHLLGLPAEFVGQELSLSTFAAPVICFFTLGLLACIAFYVGIFLFLWRDFFRLRKQQMVSISAYVLIMVLSFIHMVFVSFSAVGLAFILVDAGLILFSGLVVYQINLLED